MLLQITAPAILVSQKNSLFSQIIYEENLPEWGFYAFSGVLECKHGKTANRNHTQVF